MTDYTTTAELKVALQATGFSGSDDDIARAVTAASRAIDKACSRRFYAVDETRVYTPEFTSRGFRLTGPELEIDDLAALTSVLVDTDGDGVYETTWTSGTEFYLDPPNNALDGKPYERVVVRRQSGARFPAHANSVQIEGSFGWATTPAEVNQYCCIFATQLLLRTEQAPFGVLMAGMEIGSVTRISRYDPDFDRLLGRLVKPARMIA